MADVITYSDLFDRLKVLIKYFNKLEVRQTGTGAGDFPLPYIKNQILVPYESQDVTAELQTLEQDFDTAISTIESLKMAIISWFETALAGVASDLGEYDEATPASVLSALADAMTKDSESINARELIVHASDVDTDLTVKPHTSNVGTGKLVYTFVRPGLSPSEIAFDEVLQCSCVSSTTEKQEVFQLSGEKSHSRESHEGQGSGLGPALTVLGESIDNGDFEDWTGDAADNWTATVGAWGAEIIKEVGADRYEGTYGVKTAHAQGNWKITHPLPITLLPNTVYVMALWVKKIATATGTLRFGISNGVAVDAYVTDCVKSLDLDTGITASYVLYFLAFKTPAAVSSAWTLGISSDTPGTEDFYFDLCQFGAMTAFNNMRFAAVAGNTGFGIGDKFGFGSDNVGFKVDESEAGIIQKFIGRCFNTQLPSATAAGETIADPA